MRKKEIKTLSNHANSINDFPRSWERKKARSKKTEKHVEKIF